MFYIIILALVVMAITVALTNSSKIESINIGITGLSITFYRNSKDKKRTK